MRVRNRSLVIMLGQAIVQASAIAAAVILVRIVTQETFGTYRQVLLVYTTVTSLLSLQLEQTLYYFVPKLGDDSRRALVAQSLGATLAFAFSAAAVMYLAAGPIAAFFDNRELVGLLRVFSLFPVTEAVTLLVPAYMVGLDRAIRGSVYNAVKALSRLAIVAGSFAMGAEIATVLWLVIASSATVALVGSLDMIRLGGRGLFRIERPMLVEQLGYAVPLWLGSVTGTLNVQYDKILISAAFDPATYAIYFCGAMQLPVVILVTASVSAAMMSNLVALARDGPVANAIALWQEGIRKCSLVILTCFAFFLPISRDFMIVLYGEDYSAAAGPFAIYLLMLPVRVAVYATLFRALGQTRPVAVSGVLSLSVNVVVSTVLVVVGRGTPLAFLGPSIGTVIADYIAAGYLLLRLRPATGFPASRLLRWGELGRTLLLCAAAGISTYALGAGLPPLPILVKLAVQAIAFAGVLLLLVLATGHLKQDERQLLRAPFAMVHRALRGHRS